MDNLTARKAKQSLRALEFKYDKSHAEYLALLEEIEAKQELLKDLEDRTMFLNESRKKLTTLMNDNGWSLGKPQTEFINNTRILEKAIMSNKIYA